MKNHKNNPNKAMDTNKADTEENLKEVTQKLTQSDEKSIPSNVESETAPQPNDVFKYSIGENLLCYHGPLIYEAKILKREYWDEKKVLEEALNNKKKSKKDNDESVGPEEPGPRYFVHYKGWKSRWDEWVVPSRFLEMTQENIEKRKALDDKLTKKKQTAKVVVEKAITKKGAQGNNSRGASISHNSPLSDAGAPKRKRNPDIVEIKSKRLQATRLASGGQTIDGIALDQAQNEDSQDDESLNLRGHKGSHARTGSISDAKIPSNIKGGEPDELELLKEALSTPSSKVKLELTIPDSLKLILIGQWDLITKSQKLTSIPCRPSVRQILEMYRAYAIEKFAGLPETFIHNEYELETNVNGWINNGIGHHAYEPINVGVDSPPYIPNGNFGESVSPIDQKSPTSNEVPRTPLESVNEFVDGLALYFVRTIGSFLLYRFERIQYSTILDKFPKASESLESFRYTPDIPEDSDSANFDLLDIYGGEHLIRLLVHLPALLAHATIDASSQVMLQKYLNDMIEFMDVNKDTLFCSNYDSAAPAYSQQIHLG